MAVILLKSGLNRNEIPLAAPGKVTDLTIKTISITNKSGIRIFVDFSIPFLTPAVTINAVNPIKTKNQINGRVELPIKPLYMLTSSSGVLP